MVTGLQFTLPPPGATRFELRQLAKNTPAAVQFSQSALTPRILRREVIVLDFSEMEGLTQSYLHSLLFEPLRLAWALRTPIYVDNVEPVVRSNLEFLCSYALSGGR